MPKKHTIHRENCNTSIKISIVDMLGRTITLIGTYAFEWKVIIRDRSTITIIQFNNRAGAIKEFNKYKKLQRKSN